MSGSGPARVETPPCHPVIIRLSPVSLFDPPTRIPWRGSISPSISRVSRRYPIRAGFVLSTPRILLEGSVRNAHSNSKDPRSLLWSPTRADTGNVRTERERLSLLSGKRTNEQHLPTCCNLFARRRSTGRPAGSSRRADICRFFRSIHERRTPPAEEFGLHCRGGRIRRISCHDIERIRGVRLAGW